MICKCSIQKYLEITYTCDKSTSTTEATKSRSKRYIRLAYNLGPEPYSYGDSYGSNDNYGADNYNDDGYNGNNGRKYNKRKGNKSYKKGNGYNKRQRNKGSYKVNKDRY